MFALFANSAVKTANVVVNEDRANPRKLGVTPGSEHPYVHDYLGERADVHRGRQRFARFSQNSQTGPISNRAAPRAGVERFDKKLPNFRHRFSRARRPKELVAPARGSTRYNAAARVRRGFNGRFGHPHPRNEGIKRRSRPRIHFWQVNSLLVSTGTKNPLGRLANRHRRRLGLHPRRLPLGD